MNAVKNDTQAREKDARANSDVSGLRRKDRKIRYIAVDEIAPNPMQPRADFNDESLNALSESIWPLRLHSAAHGKKTRRPQSDCQRPDRLRRKI